MVFRGMVNGRFLDDRHTGNRGIRRKKAADVHHRAKRDVPEIGGGAVVADDAVGQHGKGVRSTSEEHLPACHADAAAAVRMIHDGQLSAVGLRLFERGELPRHGTKRSLLGEGALQSTHHEHKP